MGLISRVSSRTYRFIKMLRLANFCIKRRMSEIPIVGQTPRAPPKASPQAKTIPVNLENTIKEISLTGPMSVAAYMQRCNQGFADRFTQGYTMNRDPLGVDGDFV